MHQIGGMMTGTEAKCCSWGPTSAHPRTGCGLGGLFSVHQPAPATHLINFLPDVSPANMINLILVTIYFLGMYSYTSLFPLDS